MSISGLFSNLGAPLNNKLWSWGSVRESDGAIFLRVWQDRKKVENGRSLMMLTHRQKYADESGNSGWKERLRHVDRVREGAKCYLVMCRANDVDETPRKIADWNRREVFLGGALRDMEGDVWIEIVERVPISKAKRP